MTQLVNKWITNDTIEKEKLNANVAGNGLQKAATADAISVKKDGTTGGNVADVVSVTANGVGVLIDGTSIQVDGSGNLKAVLTGANEMYVEVLTLDGTDITNKYKALGNTPAATGQGLCSVGGVSQVIGDDFILQTSPNRIDWNGKGLDGILAAGDKLVLSYPI